MLQDNKIDITSDWQKTNANLLAKFNELLQHGYSYYLGDKKSKDIYVDDSTLTPLFTAGFFDEESNNNIFIKKMTEGILDKDTKLLNGFALVHLAAIEKNVELLNFLSIDLKADVNARCYCGYGYTPLYFAENHFEIINTLISCGADLFCNFGKNSEAYNRYKAFKAHKKNNLHLFDGEEFRYPKVFDTVYEKKRLNNQGNGLMPSSNSYPLLFSSKPSEDGQANIISKPISSQNLNTISN